MDETLSLHVPSLGMARSLPTGSFHKTSTPKPAISSSLASNHGLAYLDLGFRKRDSPLPNSRLSLLDTPTSMISHSNESETQTTLQDKMVVSLDEPVGSLSISPRNRDVCLGARKGLFILDLQNCYEPPMFLPYLSAWEVADVQWSPHPSRASWIASAAGHQVLIWNLDLTYSVGVPQASQGPIQYTLNAHSRSVTDMNFSVFDPDIIATSSLDGWVRTWDLRIGARRQASAYCGWHIAATQVKWNRQDPNILASAHGHVIHVWDKRKGSVPLHKIPAHNQRCYGLDWDRRHADKFVTCSLDKTIKFWSTKTPEQPTQIINTKAPMWRARHLPFGQGVLALPQRSDTALSIYTREGDVVETFVGHTDTPKEFVWRTKGGEDPSCDDREFQLISWGRDRMLRTWPISPETKTNVGHVQGSPIDVRMTRRGHRSSATFRASGSSLPFTSPPASIGSEGRSFPQLGSAMTTQSATKASHRLSSFRSGRKSTDSQKRSSEALLGVSPLSGGELFSTSASTATSGDEDASKSNVASFAVNQSAKPTYMTRYGAARGRNRMAIQDTMAWMEGVTREEPSQAEPSQGPNDLLQFRLGEEFAACSKEFSSRISFEKLLTRQRVCSISCFGPWAADGGTGFIRINFTFPSKYPQRATPVIDLERNGNLSLKQRASLLRGLRHAATQCLQAKEPALRACLEYLLGDRPLRSVRPSAEESSSEDEDIPQNTTPLRAFNVPLPRRCGAVFGPQDQLVCFFPFAKQAVPPQTLSMSMVQSIEGIRESRSPHRQRTERSPSAGRRKNRHLFETFGAVAAQDAQLNSSDDESDEILRQPFKRARFDPSMTPRDHSHSRSVGRGVKLEISTVVHVKSLGNISPLRPASIRPDMLRGGSLDILLRNADIATVPLAVKKTFQVWSELLSGTNKTSARRQVLPTSLAMLIFVKESIHLLCTQHDIQSLGVLACALEQVRRAFDKNRRDSRASNLLAGSKIRANSTASRNDATPSELSARPDQHSLAWNSLSALLGDTPSKSIRAAEEKGQTTPQPRSRRPSVTSTIGPLYSESDDRKSSIARRGLPNTLTRRATRNPSNVTFETYPGRAIIGRMEGNQTPTASMRKFRIKAASTEVQAPWFDAGFEAQLECFRLNYAELLYRWGHFQLRTEVLAATRMAVDSSFGFAYDGLLDEPALQLCFACTTCGTELQRDETSWCSRCQVEQTAVAVCSLCHRKAQGLVQSCLLCGHTGHLRCYQSFFSTESLCPSGCGCQCSTSSGLAGAFVPRINALWQ